MTEVAQRIVLASRPVGEPTQDNFRLEELPIPQPRPGHVLLRTLWLSLDPYMRGRMSDAPSYAKPVGIGEVMEGGTVSEVVASNVARFAKGDIVVGRTGWQTYALSDGSSLHVTSAHWWVPGLDQKIGGKGIQPDIAVEENAVDAQFVEKAVEAVKALK